MKKRYLLIAASAIGFSMANVANALHDDLYKMTNQEGRTVDDIEGGDLSDRAFEALIEQMYPTSTDRLRNIKEQERELQKTLYDNRAPTPESRIIPIQGKIGEPVQTVYVSPLHTTVISIVDATGEPWPLTSISFGNELDYTVQTVDGHEYNNAIAITPKRAAGTTNMIFTLVDQPVAFNIILKSTDEKFNPAPLLQVQKYGPRAKQGVVQTQVGFGNVKIGGEDGLDQDTILKNIILGIAPSTFQKLVTTDTEVEAWLYGDDLYIRTNYMPMSPLPMASFHGPNSFSAYRMRRLPVVVFTNPNGLETKVYFKGYKHVR